MPQVINTNISSLNAQRNLNKSQSTLQRSLQRLSTGLRVNSAKDDAAGLAISERMTAQIRGLNQAVRNANDGVSLAQTAEGSLQTVSDSLLRIRELAIQSANATNSGSDRQALQAEVNQLLSEIQRVSDTTEFNGLKLFDGGFSSQNFQVGSNANQTIGISIEEVSNTTLFTGYDLSNIQNATTGQGTGSVFANNGALNDAPENGIEAQTLTFTSASGTTTVSVADNASVKDIAASINAIESTNGVTATATTTGTLSAFDFSEFSLTVNNTGVGGIQTGTGFTVATASSLAAQTLTRTNSDGSTTVMGATTTAGASARTQAAEIAAGLSITTITAGTTITLSNIADDAQYDFQIGQSGGALTAIAGARDVTGGSLTNLRDSIAAADANLTVTVVGATIEITNVGNGTAGENIIIAGLTGAGGGAQTIDVETNGVSSTITEAGNDAVIATGSITSMVDDAFFTIESDTAAAGGGVLAGAANAQQTVATHQITMNYYQGTGSSPVAISVAVAHELDLGNLATALDAIDGITATHSPNGTITVTDADGDDIIFDDVTVTNNGTGADGYASATVTGSDTGTATLSTAGNDSAVFVGTLSLSSHKAFSVQSNVDDSAGSVLSANNDTDVAAVKNNSFSVDVSTQAGAQDVIEIMDSALDTINSVRGNLGALQNRFEAAIGNISNISENLAAARSRIRDADFAYETAELTKAQILQQAGISILGQANALPQNALALLQ